MGRAVEWHGVAACCRGRSHYSSGIPCQDRALVVQQTNGVMVAALADGAGSAMFSHFGADLVVRKAADAVTNKFDEVVTGAVKKDRFSQWLIKGLQWELLQLAREGVPALGEDRARLDLPSAEESPLIPCDISDLASTLLLVAVKQNDSYLCLHLGDGVLGMSSTNFVGRTTLSVVSTPDNGEHANETVFVTSAGATSSVRVRVGRISQRIRSIDGFVLMSDGAEASLYDKQAGCLSPACMQLLQACRDLPEDEIGQQLDGVLRKQLSQKTQDDCSIALLAR